MRRYPLLFILLLSFMMPLQVAAEILLSATQCPEETTMQMDESGAGETMPCCPEEDDTDKVNQCKTAQSCHLCKTPVQVFIYSPAPFSSLLISSLHLKTPSVTLTVFNPASIWRPPNIS